MLILGITVAVVFVFAAILGLCLCRVGDEDATPLPEKADETLCHYCNELIVSDPLRLQCPNCKDEHVFHTDCGFDLKHKPLPSKCGGKSMEHPSGHILSTTYPNMCARCTLGRIYWDEWVCAEDAAHLNETKLFMERRRDCY